MDCHFLLQGTLLAQGPNLHLLHWRADSLPRSHHRRPFPNWLSIKFSKPTWWSRSCYYPCAVNKEGGVESIRFFFFFRNYGVGRWQSQKPTSGCHYLVPKPAALRRAPPSRGILRWDGEEHSSLLQILHLCLQRGDTAPFSHLHSLREVKGVSWGEPCH